MVIGGLYVTSFIPGRLRLKVEEVRHSPDFGLRLRSTLGCVPGIVRVEVNPSTGSVLVHYETVVVTREPGRHKLTEAIHALFPAADTAVLLAWLDRAS